MPLRRTDDEAVVPAGGSRPGRARERRRKLLAALVSLSLHAGVGLWMLTGAPAGAPNAPEPPIIALSLAPPRAPDPPEPAPSVDADPEGGGGGSAAAPVNRPEPRRRFAPEPAPMVESPFRETAAPEAALASAPADAGAPDSPAPETTGAAGPNLRADLGAGGGEGPGLGTGSGPGEGTGPGSGAGRGGDGRGRGVSLQPPGWRVKPTPYGISPNFPKLAKARRVPGEATIRCRVSLAGEARDCVVLSETPSHLRFGRAALRDARRFQLRPATVDGRYVDGGEMVIVLRYHLTRNAPGGSA